jgi:26S proteasome regulatory subunit N12
VTFHFFFFFFLPLFFSFFGSHCLCSDKHIVYPVTMEQHMMEGSYHKVIKASHHVPSPSAAFFVSLVADTVRLQIAECISRA